MSLSSVDKIAGIVGALSSEQDTVKQNISPDDPSAIVKCNFGEIVDVIGFGNKYIYSRDIDTFTYNQD